MPITIYQNVHLDETKLLTPTKTKKDYIGVVVTRLIQLKHAVALSFSSYRQYGGLFPLIRGCSIEISISRNAQTLLKLIQLKHAVKLSFFVDWSFFSKLILLKVGLFSGLNKKSDLFRTQFWLNIEFFLPNKQNRTSSRSEKISKFSKKLP